MEITLFGWNKLFLSYWWYCAFFGAFFLSWNWTTWPLTTLSTQCFKQCMASKTICNWFCSKYIEITPQNCRDHFIQPVRCVGFAILSMSVVRYFVNFFRNFKVLPFEKIQIRGAYKLTDLQILTPLTIRIDQKFLSVHLFRISACWGVCCKFWQLTYLIFTQSKSK